MSRRIKIPVLEAGTERLIGLPEVAKMLDVCPRTVRRLFQRGNLPKPVKVAGCVRFVKSEVDAYLQGLKEQRA